jgi:hypothetical protein
MLANTWYWSDHGTPVGKMSILIFKRNISLNYRVAFYGCLSMSYI